MRKIILGTLLFISTVAFSQVQFGLKAGANISNLSGLDFKNISTQAQVGFHIGGFIAIKIGRLAIQPELLYSTQRVRFDSVSVNSKDLQLNYFTIPIMLKYRTHGGFYLETGPVFGYKINADLSGQNFNDYISTADFSWAAGLGYHGSGGFGIGARYNVGLSKVVNNDFASSFQNADYKNAVLQVSLFYSLFGNGKHKEARKKVEKGDESK